MQLWNRHTQKMTLNEAKIMLYNKFCVLNMHPVILQLKFHKCALKHIRNLNSETWKCFFWHLVNTWVQCEINWLFIKRCGMHECISFVCFFCNRRNRNVFLDSMVTILTGPSSGEHRLFHKPVVQLTHSLFIPAKTGSKIYIQ